MPTIYKSDTGKRRVEESYRSLLNQWPEPVDFVTVPTREGDTFVVVSGPETAPPLVLLHGSMGNAITWLGEISAYAKHFRCYCVDIVGEPGFSAPSRPDLNTEASALWLDDVLTGLGIDKASFVALSLGGLIAFDYAARRPGRVTALAGIAPAGICRTKNVLFRFLPLFFMGEWGKQKMREAVTGKLFVDNAPGAVAFRAFFDLIADEFRPRMERLPMLSDAQVSGLDFPVLAIVGGKDVLLNTDDTRDRLRALAPQANVDYRPAARHYIAGTEKDIVPFLLDANGLTA